MGIFDGWLLAADYDGTFAAPGSVLDEVNIESVRRFEAEGGYFTIASGRPVSFIQELVSKVPINAPLIAMNGTLILSPDGRDVLARYALDEGILTLMDQAFRQGLCENMMLWNDQNTREKWNWTADTGVTPGAFYRDLIKPWYKVVMIQPQDRTLRLRDWFHLNWGDRYTGFRCWEEGFEIQPHGSGKGQGMTWIRAHSGLEIRKTVGTGDFENDISLVRDADIGYAVDNALPCVKAAADRITVHHSRHAVAAIIAELEKELRGL